MTISVLLLFLNIYFLLSTSWATQNSFKSEVGPYKSTLVRSERCKSPSKPYEKDLASYFYSELYTSGKKILLRGNLTVVRVDTNTWLSAKGLILEDGKYRVMYVANAEGCHGLLMKIFKMGLNIQDINGCVPKGTYIYQGVDFNRIQHTWTKTSLYGSFLWRLQVGSRAGTTICWEYQTITTPISNNSTSK